MNTPPEFPSWLLEDEDDPEDMSAYKSIAEWVWAHSLTPKTRLVVREQANDHREILADAGFDLSNERTCEGLWVAWLCTSATWQPFLIGDCFPENAEHLATHATRALQWSAVVLLLTTEPNVPDPEPGMPPAVDDGLSCGELP